MPRFGGSHPPDEGGACGTLSTSGTDVLRRLQYALLSATLHAKTLRGPLCMSGRHSVASLGKTCYIV